MARSKAWRAERRRSVAEARVAAFAAAVRERFPGCPLGEEERVARYACRRGSGRVGQVAVINGYLDEAVELAVVAHLRHRFSAYESHLGRGCSRDEAREQVQAEVSRLLRAWICPGSEGQQGGNDGGA